MVFQQHLLPKCFEFVSKICTNKQAAVLRLSCTAQTQKIMLISQLLEEIERFAYLGSIIAQNGDAEVDIKHCIGKVTAILQMYKIWSLLSISLKNKLCQFTSIVIPIAIYASKIWKVPASIHKRQ